VTVWGSGSLALQNVALVQNSSGCATQYVVDGMLAAGMGAVTSVAAWFLGPAFVDGGLVQSQGALPLPSRAAAPGAGLCLACAASDGSANLCGGSAEAPATGVPARPRLSFAGAAPVNALSFGAVGDGVHDDTAALRAAFAAHPAVFLPAGTYAISDTLALPCNATLVGEGLAALALVAAAPGFGDRGRLKAVLATAADADCSAQVADVALTTLGLDNEGALLLDWQAGLPGVSGLWDVTARLYYRVGLKARFGPPAPSDAGPSLGGGYVSNAWLWAADHNLTDLGSMNCYAANCTSHAPVEQPAGVRVTTRGPLFMMATDFEHTTGGAPEYHFDGAANVFAAHLQTENTTTSVRLDNTSLVTLVAGLHCIWVKNFTVDAAVQARRVGGGANCVAAGAQGPGGAALAPPRRLDASYRLVGILERQSRAQIVDEGHYSVAGSADGWTAAGAFLNSC
jgi:hypothetical protein